MKKGDIIEIKQSAKYDGKSMRWTETKTGTKKIAVGETWFHVSSYEKLKSFFPKETCFADQKYSEGYYYALKVISPITVDCYDDDEIRIDLEKYRNDVEIYYIGTITGKNENGKRIRKDNTITL